MPVTVVQTIADKGDRLKGHLVPTNSYCITHVLTPALLVPFALLTHCRAKREECFHTYCDNCRNKKIHSSFIIQFTALVVGTPKSLHHISNILTVSVTGSVSTWRLWNRAAVQITFCPNSFIYWFRASLYKEKYILKPIFTQKRFFFFFFYIRFVSHSFGE